MSEISKKIPATALWTLALCAWVCVWLHLNIADKRNMIDFFPDLLELKHRANASHYKDLVTSPRSYIDSTSAQNRLHLAIHDATLLLPFSYTFNYARRRDLEQSGWPVSNHSKCGQELESIIELLVSNPNYTSQAGELAHQLTNYMDSFGKPESGVFANGNNNWMGSYENCLASEPNSIKTRYCVARFRHKSWPDKDIAQPRVAINVGFCLPETCDTLAYNGYSARMELLAKFELPSQYKQQLNMESLYCLPDERSPLRQVPISGRIYLTLVGGWLALVAMASILYDCFLRKKDSKPSKEFTENEASQLFVQALKALSIRCSLRIFKSTRFRVRYNKGELARVDLSCLDFFKIIIALVIVFAHSIMIGIMYLKYSGQRIKLLGRDSGKFLVTFGLFVDTFFLLFGMLTSYSLLNKFNPKQLGRPLVWFQVNVMILLKVMPLFALTFWFSRSISPYLGAGPWWDYGVDRASTRAVCMHDPWWKSIPYLGNVHPGAACNPPSWFLAHYALIALLLPLITYLLYKLPHYALKVGLVAFLATISNFSVAFKLLRQTVLPAEALGLFGGFMVVFVEKYESTGYRDALGRLGVVSIGALLGYTLYLYKIGAIERWPGWLRSRFSLALACLIKITIMLLPFVAHKALRGSNSGASLESFVIGGAIAAIIWPVTGCLIIIHLTTIRNHKPLVRFMGHPFWRVFNKLGFCIFMLHYEILQTTLTNFEQAPLVGFWSEAIRCWSYTTLVSIVLGLFVHIFIEQPISSIVDLCFTRPTKNSKPKSETVLADVRLLKMSS